MKKLLGILILCVLTWGSFDALGQTFISGGSGKPTSWAGGTMTAQSGTLLGGFNFAATGSTHIAITAQYLTTDPNWTSCTFTGLMLWKFDSGSVDHAMFYCGKSGNWERVATLQAGLHTMTLGTAPALSGCGTSATIAGNDNTGRITVGTTPGTSCTVTFAVAWTNAPVCTVSFDGSNASVLVPQLSTTALVVLSKDPTSFVDNQSLVAGDKIIYSCRGY